MKYCWILIFLYTSSSVQTLTTFGHFLSQDRLLTLGGGVGGAGRARGGEGAGKAKGATTVGGDRLGLLPTQMKRESPLYRSCQNLINFDMRN
jgi:hypothetical protein